MKARASRVSVLRTTPWTRQGTVVPCTPDSGGLPVSLTGPMAFCLGLKQVIGGGVIVLTGTAVALTGAGAAPAYLLASLVVLLVSLPYAVLGAADPVSGSLYRWPARYIDPVAGFLGFWMVLGTHVGLAAYTATFGATLHALLPGVPARLAGPAMLLLVLALNLVGAAASARAGILITSLVGVALLALAACGLPQIEPRRLAVLLPHGWHGLLSAAALLTYPLSGATLVTELGGEMRRPARDLPVAIIGATVVAALLYAVVALVVAGLPGTAAATGAGALTAVAARVMDPAGAALFGVGVGIVSMLGIVNAHMLWGSRSILMVCQDRWLPGRFGRPNRFGAPGWPLCLLAAIGILPVLAGIDIADILRVAGLGAAGSAILSVACAPIYARRQPAAYAASALAIPRGLLLAAAIAAIGSQLVTLSLLLRDLPPRLGLLWLGWMAAGLLLALAQRRMVVSRAA